VAAPIDYDDLIKKNPEKFFDNSSDFDVKAKFLGNKELAGETIVSIMNGYELTNPQDKEKFVKLLEIVVKNSSKRVSLTEPQMDKYLSNIGNLIRAACLKDKFSSLLETLVDKNFFSETMKNSSLTKEQKIRIIDTFYRNIVEVPLRKKVVSETDKDLILEYIIDNNKKSSNISIFSNKEILNANDARLNDKIVEALNKKDKCIDTFDMLINNGKKQLVETIIDRLNNTEFEALIDEINKTPGALQTYMEKMPQKFVGRVASVRKDLFDSILDKLEDKKKAELISSIKDEKTLQEVYKKLDEKSQNAVKNQLKNPTVTNVKDKIGKVTGLVGGIKKDYHDMRVKRWDNRFGKVSRVYNGLAAKILEWRIHGREEKLLKLGELHTSENRLGVMGRLQILLYMRSAKKYEELNKRLENRQENIKKIDAKEEKNLKKIDELKEKIATKKEKIKKESEIARLRIDHTWTRQKLADFDKELKADKASKVGKITVNKEKLSQAWGIILGTPGKINELKEDKISSIITSSPAFANLTKNELESLIGKVNGKMIELQAQAATMSDPEGYLETEIRGMRMGISNYALIMAVTAITITGLIILLTMILS